MRSALGHPADGEILSQLPWSAFVPVMLNLLKEASPVALKTALEELGGSLGFREAFAEEDKRS